MSSWVICVQVTSATRLLSEGAGILLSLAATPSRSDPSDVMAPLTVPPVLILMTRSRVSIPEIAGMPCCLRKSSSVLPPYMGEGSAQYSLTTSPRTWTSPDWQKSSRMP